MERRRRARSQQRAAYLKKSFSASSKPKVLLLTGYQGNHTKFKGSYSLAGVEPRRSKDMQ